jgi:hypothetical protein
MSFGLTAVRKALADSFQIKSPQISGGSMLKCIPNRLFALGEHHSWKSGDPTRRSSAQVQAKQPLTLLFRPPRPSAQWIRLLLRRQPAAVWRLQVLASGGLLSPRDAGRSGSRLHVRVHPCHRPSQYGCLVSRHLCRREQPAEEYWGPGENS